MDTLSIRSKTRRIQPPAVALVATSGISSQCGAAIATRLFDQVGPTGTLTLRLVFATVALVAVARPGRSDLRRLLHPARRADLAVMVGFGLALAGMNLSFYESIARIPLGVAVTIEFVGPLTLSVLSSRRWNHVLWALLAGGGVVLLASGDLFGVGRHLDTAGVGFALLAGAGWAAYILMSKETGRRFPGTSGLAGAMAVAALLITPFGVLHAGRALLRPEVLAVGLAVAILASALPYRCELAALRRATPRAFGVLVSMAPALAALAGLAILGQRLSGLEVGALVLVVAANAGSTWFGERGASPPAVAGPASVDPAVAGWVAGRAAGPASVDPAVAGWVAGRAAGPASVDPAVAEAAAPDGEPVAAGRRLRGTRPTA